MREKRKKASPSQKSAKSKEKPEKIKKINFAKEQNTVRCILQLEKPIAIERSADFPQIGRFTLRDEGKTIAIGKVLDLNL